MPDDYGSSSFHYRDAAGKATDPSELLRGTNFLFYRLWRKGQKYKDYNEDEWAALQLALNKLGIKI